MTQVFNYSTYSSDYINKWLTENEDSPSWFRDFLLGDSTVEQNRDDDLEDYLSAQTYVPSLAVVRTTNQTVATNTAVKFEGVSFQSTSLYDWTATADTRITVEDSGITLIIANLAYAIDATGNYRACQIQVNGIPVAAATTDTGGGAVNPNIGVPTMQSLVAGDYIEMFAVHDNGGTIAVTGQLSVAYLGKVG